MGEVGFGAGGGAAADGDIVRSNKSPPMGLEGFGGAGAVAVGEVEEKKSPKPLDWLKVR